MQLRVLPTKPGPKSKSYFSQLAWKSGSRQHQRSGAASLCSLFPSMDLAGNQFLHTAPLINVFCCSKWLNKGVTEKNKQNLAIAERGETWWIMRKVCVLLIHVSDAFFEHADISCSTKQNDRFLCVVSWYVVVLDKISHSLAVQCFSSQGSIINRSSASHTTV